jgi:hypothetical protein
MSYLKAGLRIPQINQGLLLLPLISGENTAPSDSAEPLGPERSRPKGSSRAISHLRKGIITLSIRERFFQRTKLIQIIKKEK